MNIKSPNLPITLILIITAISACTQQDPVASTQTVTQTVTETVTATATETVTVTATPTQDADEARLENAVREYTNAFFTDAEEAYSLLSDKCQAAFPYDQYKLVIAAAKAQFPSGSEIETLEVKVNGTKATATYSLEHSELNQTNESWVLQDDGWRYNQC